MDTSAAYSLSAYPNTSPTGHFVSAPDNTEQTISEAAPSAVEEQQRLDNEQRQNQQQQDQEREQAEVRQLASRDREVRRHEQAHAAVGGVYAGNPHYQLTTGPNGVSYATSGHVTIDVSVIPGDPQATLEKMQTVKRAALAPAQPSAQDRAVAAEASAAAIEARTELRNETSEKAEEKAAERAAEESGEDVANEQVRAYQFNQSLDQEGEADNSADNELVNTYA